MDGFVGRQTLAALNVPVGARLRTLNLNKARIQTFKPWGPSYVLVIVPGFEARLIRELEPVLKTRVIVGEPGWPTPQLNGMLSRVEVNPYWNVPRSILIREIIPRMQRDPGYLARENFRVFTGWDANARELDPAEVDWSGPAARTYRLRQDPGPRNALGSFKFTFKNSQSIYLHDTRSRRLFNRSARALSHGCVRVEQPMELAELLLAGQRGWDSAKLKSAISRGTNRGIAIERPLPVHLVYWTAWVDEAGRTQFRRDIYNHDPKIYTREDTRQRGT
jgi:murein L,D-transpeptidase YcbB/YkuD